MNSVTRARITKNMRRIFLVLFIIFDTTKVSLTEAREEVAFNDLKNEALQRFLPVDIVTRFSYSGYNFSRNANLTDKCFEDLKFFVSGLRDGSEWALKMIDASSKLPSGILTGNTASYGDYDECMAVRVVLDGDEIRGRHCMYRISVRIGKIKLSESLSVCLPAGCGREDLDQILNEITETVNDDIDPDPSIVLGHATCSTVWRAEWTAGGIATVVGFSLLLLILAICTICDIFVRNFGGNLSENVALASLCRFSVYTNAVRILSTKTTPQTLPAIQGLRFFSMCWVVLGHEYYMSLFSFPMNSLDLKEWTFSWNSVYIMIAPFAVDTFFTISGFLMSYLFLREMAKGRSFNVFGYYIHRYVRLTPAYAAVLLMTMFIFPRMGSGPIWEKNMNRIQETCRDKWWSMLLYVQNYVAKDGRSCLGHTWYLAVEMHFFWISPLILLPLAKKPWIGLTILSLFFSASIFVPAKISFDDRMASGLFVNNANVKSMSMDFYTATHNRGSAWLIGIFLGYVVFKKNERPGKMIEFIGWFLATAAFIFCIAITRNDQLEGYEYHAAWETFVMAFSRPVWSFGVAWIIYACVCGFGGPLTKFLSLGVFNPFSRISYCMYLVHFVIEIMKISAIRFPRYFSDFNIFNYFLSDFTLTVVVGFTFSLVFESPILILEKLLMKNIPRTDQKTKVAWDNDKVGTGINKSVLFKQRIINEK